MQSLLSRKLIILFLISCKPWSLGNLWVCVALFNYLKVFNLADLKMCHLLVAKHSDTEMWILTFASFELGCLSCWWAFSPWGCYVEVYKPPNTTITVTQCYLLKGLLLLESVKQAQRLTMRLGHVKKGGGVPVYFSSVSKLCLHPWCSGCGFPMGRELGEMCWDLALAHMVMPELSPEFAADWREGLANASWSARAHAWWVNTHRWMHVPPEAGAGSP